MALNYYDFRLVIGPPWRHKNSAYHYDWSTHDVNAADTFLSDLTVATQLSATGTQIYTSDNSAYPLAGGFWVGPASTAQGWEYMEYSGLNDIAFWFNGLTRQPTADQEGNGIHGVGAPVKFWWHIETDAGRFELNEYSDGNLATVAWRGQCGGVLVPRPALRNNHLCIVQTRTDPAGTWTNALVGWLQGVNIRDDGRRYGEWDIQIVSSADMINRYEVAGVRAGDLDIAKHGSASGSTPLNRAYKERTSGDYTAAEPTFDHANVLDRDTSTLWIAEQFIGTANSGDRTTNADPHWVKTGTNEEYESQFVISGIYLERPPGYDSEGYRWIELTAVKVSDGTTFIRDCWLACETGSHAYADIGGTDVEEGEKIVLCESEDVYREENPLATPKTIVEIGKEGTAYYGWWDNLDTAGDTIALRQVNSPREWMHGVTWGTGSGTTALSKDSEPEFSWSGSSNVPAPDPGEAIRYLYKGNDGLGTSTDAADYWDVGGVVTPGYTIGVYDRDDDGWNLGQIHEVYLTVDIPALPLELAEDITSGDPGNGDTLYINDASGPNTNGLPSSGTLQIGDEQITYSAKSEKGVTVTARGYSTTLAAAHNAGDAVRLLVGDLATSAPPVKSVGWRRSGSGPRPKNFRVYYTLDENARTPVSEFYANDWTLLVTATNITAETWDYEPASSFRARKVMIVFDAMTGDPARPRINEFIAKVDEDFYTSSTFTTTADAAEVIETILGQAGVPTGAITNSVSETALVDTVTAADYAWSIIADVADYTALKVTVARDSKITIATNSINRAAGLSGSEAWTRTNAAAVEFVQSGAAPVRQVRIEWTQPDGGTSGTAEYPATVDETDEGGVLDLAAMIYPDGTTATAAAQRRYWMLKYPYTLLVECAEQKPAARPLQLHTVTWDMSNTDDANLERLMVVEGASHRIENHIWTTVLTGRQIDRKSEA